MLFRRGAGGGPYRIELKSADTRAWDLITSQPVRRVFHTPTWKDLESLTPRVYFRLRPGAKEVRLTLEADGERFKGAVLYDPQGIPVTVTERFVEYGDTKHHQYELKAAVPGGAVGRAVVAGLAAGVGEQRGGYPARM